MSEVCTLTIQWLQVMTVAHMLVTTFCVVVMAVQGLQLRKIKLLRATPKALLAYLDNDNAD